MQQLDPRTLVIVTVLLGLVFALFATAVWWTRRSCPGYGRWTGAGLLLVVALCLMGLRPFAPDWISIVGANALVVIASILYLEGARQFVGLAPRNWLAYAAGLLAVTAVAYFDYAVPSLNARVSLVSSFMGILLLLTSIRLLKTIPPRHKFGTTLTGVMLLMSALEFMARAAYFFHFAPPPQDLFALTGIAAGFLAAIVATLAGAGIGFILLADERVLVDLEDAKDMALSAKMEVDEHKQVEAALRASEERFRKMADTAPVMIWVAGPDKLCNFFNKPWLDFTGRAMEQELGNGWATGVHPEDLDRCFRTYSSSFDARDSFTMEYRLRRADGEYRWILDNGTPFYNEAEFAGYIGSCIDVTEFKQTQEALAEYRQQLQRLTAGLLTAQESESRELARELHDVISQELAVVAMEISSLKENVKPGVAGRLSEIGNRAGRLANDIHQTSRQLHPTVLEELGLEPALRQECQAFQERSGILTRFTAKGVLPELSKDARLCLYRVAQESLRNVGKHAADARAVRVSLEGDLQGVTLVVKDSGGGFEVDRALKKGGLGLISMEERMRLVKGTLRIRSAPAKGTTVTAFVPAEETLVNQADRLRIPDVEADDV
jgi:PAS domain S-box-containing protein